MIASTVSLLIVGVAGPAIKWLSLLGKKKRLNCLLKSYSQYKPSSFWFYPSLHIPSLLSMKLGAVIATLEYLQALTSTDSEYWYSYNAVFCGEMKATM